MEILILRCSMVLANSNIKTAQIMKDHGSMENVKDLAYIFSYMRVKFTKETGRMTRKVEKGCRYGTMEKSTRVTG